NGNADTQTQNIIIDDVTAPTPDNLTLADITAECQVLAADVPIPTATDNCGATIQGTHNLTFPISTQGTHVITWTFDDGNGNADTQTQNIIIDDVTTPTPDNLTLADITAECQVLAADVPVPTATDNCGETIYGTHNLTFPISTQGTHVITWTFDDGKGNADTQTQSIIIDDVTTPTPDVTNLPVIERQCAVLATDIPIPTATDNCEGSINATTTDPLTYNNQGTHTITWTFNDGNGNTSTQTQSIIVHPSPIENVSLNDLTVTYDGNLHQINVNNLPTGASVSYSTTPNTGEANGAINAGVYTVTAIVSPPANAINCEDISLTATLTIEKAPQEITFNSLPILYIEDDDDFQLTATASSGLPVDYTYTFTANNPPATVSSTGWVTLLTSGMIEITAHQAGNENYLPATPVMQPLQINSRDANIHRLFVGNDTYVNPPEEIYYLIDCETEQEYVNILIETEINAEVTPAHSFDIAVPKPGIYKQKVKVTSQDGEHQKSYTIIIEKRFSFEDIVVQKFNNVLLVNNNPSTNGGYSFIDYWWYKNGEMIAQNQYYSAGSTAYDLLNPQDEYWVKMLTTTGEVLQTCIGQINLKNYNGSIYPNPTQAASYITVQVGFPDKELKDIHIDLYNLNGALVKRYKSSQRITELKLPEELAIGTYLLVCTTAHYKETFRLIVE
ncbi:HYR-like domain-containing protein, partial [Mesonia hippocampi]|uniref:HYR-like domain-containing protein n=1 Tax=Mesonia hippocampi TaxID=1628250 RepID=UPI003F95F4DA